MRGAIVASLLNDNDGPARLNVGNRAGDRFGHTCLVVERNRRRRTIALCDLHNIALHTFDDTGGEVNNVTITNNTLQNNATGIQIGVTGVGADANYIVAKCIKGFI